MQCTYILARLLEEALQLLRLSVIQKCKTVALDESIWGCKTSCKPTGGSFHRPQLRILCLLQLITFNVNGCEVGFTFKEAFSPLEKNDEQQDEQYPVFANLVPPA